MLQPKETSSSDQLFLAALAQLNVLPLDERQLDLWLLNALGAELPVRLMAKLLKQKEFEFGLDLRQHKQLESTEKARLAAMQERFSSLANQQQKLQLGFPLLLLEDEGLGQLVQAPIFIWELQLEAAEDGDPRHWMLSYNSDSALQYNELLQNYLISRFKLDWEEILPPKEELKAQTLLDALNQLAEKLGLDAPGLPKLYPCPHPQLSEEERPKNAIYWAGILGQLEQHEELDSDLPLGLKGSPKPLWHSKLAALAVSGPERTLLQALYGGQNVQQLQSSVGLPRLPIAAIAPLLADGGNALVVCPLNRIEAYQNQFMEQGVLPGPAWVWKNKEEARAQLFSLLAKEPKKQSEKEQASYQLQLQKYLLQLQKLNQGQAALGQEGLLGEDWSQMLGRYLGYQQEEGKQFLSRILQKEDYIFSPKEYEELLQAIREQEQLFAPVRSLAHPLSQLRDELFLENTEEAAEQLLQKELPWKTEEFRQLHLDYSSFLDAYYDELLLHHQQHAMALRKQLDRLQEMMVIYQKVYGDEFGENRAGYSNRLRLMSVFSKRHQQLLAAKQQIAEEYEQLLSLYDSKRYFVFALKEMRQFNSINALYQHIQEFEKRAQHWGQRLPKQMREKVNALELSSILPLDRKSQLQALEERLMEALEGLNALPFFKKRFNLGADSLPAREQFLRDSFAQLLAIEEELPNFLAYYRWRKHWLLLGKRGRQLLQALIASRPKSWETAFKSWYYYNYLAATYSLALPSAGTDLQDLLAQERSLQPHLREAARKNVALRHEELHQDWKKNNKLPLSQGSRAWQDEPLAALIERLGWERIHQLSPVIMATPAMLEEFLPERLAHFELVLLESGEQMPAERSRRLLQLGAQQWSVGELPLSSFRGQSAAAYSMQPKALSLPAPSFGQALKTYLSRYIDEERLLVNQKVEGVWANLLVASSRAGEKPLILLLDGWMKQQAPGDYLSAVEAQNRLAQEGYWVLELYSFNFWQNRAGELRSLAAAILNWDK
ncbi:hypothetical protein SapgrDRAFT_0625 [Saprospira grandis DSM 2844]|uniref:Uncharacterized protein n=1 Tax=Saprospira grandis DSM 2844 TaxID=694433 RepID=J1I249_9BACT|nr:hypothetical protein [Saprospira grandis]EJF52368.1 hypothetical protein SapgrDRAFT_0625 [Saprospira grandis DSM 2844]